ncbi:MAG: hypothetical protein AAGF77_01495 [Bacteroidota bacterium]
MKTIRLILTLLIGLSVSMVFAQNPSGGHQIVTKLKKFSDRTLFQRFDQELVPTAAERQAKYRSRRAWQSRLLTIIDTSQIRMSSKIKLSNDVQSAPFSDRLQKFLDKNELRDQLPLEDYMVTLETLD